MKKNVERPSWLPKLKTYEKPSRGRAIWQLINTLVPYLSIVVLMYFSLQWGWPIWGTLLLAIPGAAFLVRAFIIFHDCVHGSFFASRKANRFWGTVLGVMTFTSYGSWQHGHGVHHSTAGNLDRRTIGEIWTLTVEEYRNASRGTRLWYRIYRNPVVLFLIAPIILFVGTQRFPDKSDNARQRRSVLVTNLILLGIVALAYFTIGLGPYLLIQLSIMQLAGMGGIWLFYVQHQFDPGYWEREEEWNDVDAALEGSSYYKLPAVLQWFSGNIGLHHVHHLKPRIPNYNLPRALADIPELQLDDYLSVKDSVSSIFLNLWDEERKELISFRQMRRRPAQA